MDSIIKIIITDDNALQRTVLKDNLERYNITTIAEAEHGTDLLHLLSENVKPDLILLDLEMPILDGNKTFDLIKERYADIKVIVLSMFASDGLIDNYIKRGANGFLSKDLISPDLGNLADAIKEVNSGVNYFLGSDEIAIKYTNMEALIIPELCQGKTSQIIAGELNLSEKSIEKHKHNIYKKNTIKNCG